MDFEELYLAFKNQMMNARKKRVPFTINFKYWLDTWGDNIDQRGRLQLQRIDKSAGYVEGNLVVGTRPAKGGVTVRY